MKKQFATNLDEDVIKNLKRIAVELDTGVNTLIEAAYYYLVYPDINAKIKPNFRDVVEYYNKTGCEK